MDLLIFGVGGHGRVVREVDGVVGDITVQNKVNKAETIKKSNLPVGIKGSDKIIDEFNQPYWFKKHIAKYGTESNLFDGA